MPARFSPRILVLIGSLLLFLSGCTGALVNDGARLQPEQQSASLEEELLGAGPEDPYETTNRDLLDNNLWTYDHIVGPVVEAYRWAVPEALRAGISNAIDNLSQPRIFVNDLLQGEWERAADSFARFAFNSTIGFAGLFDRASQMSIPRHDEDFGQTLAVYGVEPGPYLVLPLLGPTTPRDALGRLVDMALDPANYFPITAAALANLSGSTVDRFSRNPERLAELRETSLDFYATLRGAYLQNRAFEIGNGVEPVETAETADAWAEALGEDLEEADIEPSSGGPAPALSRSVFPLAGL